MEHTPSQNHRQPIDCVTVIEAVATREGVDPHDLEPPLYDAVDPGALETLLSTTEKRVTVSFEYAGYDIVAGSDGTLTVE